MNAPIDPPPTPGPGRPPGDPEASDLREEGWERLLRSEPLFDLPPTFVARTLLGLPPREHRRPAWAAIARLAAAAACFVVAWLSLAGTAPAVAGVLPSEAVAAVLAPAQEASPLPAAADLLRVAPDAGAADAPAWGVGALGLGLLILGPVLARRWRRPVPETWLDENARI